MRNCQRYLHRTCTHDSLESQKTILGTPNPNIITSETVATSGFVKRNVYNRVL